MLPHLRTTTAADSTANQQRERGKDKQREKSEEERQRETKKEKQREGRKEKQKGGVRLRGGIGRLAEHRRRQRRL